MKIGDTYHRSITLTENGRGIRIIDQRALPWELKFVELHSANDTATAIHEMWVRGAPLIGAVGAYGLAMAIVDDPSDENLAHTHQQLFETRPTAINLKWALDAVRDAVHDLSPAQRADAAYARAAEIAEEDISLCKKIGEYGAEIIRQLHAQNPQRPVQIMTHCNTGWLATVDIGTALGVIYTAHDAGIPVHVWVSETRPRNQGSALTAWELSQHGVPHTVIADNAAGLLMQRGDVDICIVGADRVTRNGDVCNKVGTYLKALAAKAHHTPFYVALPYTTVDASLATGTEIPIEERSAEELTHFTGPANDGCLTRVRMTHSVALNPAFDITPAELVTGYITERGILPKI
ncbi:MAG TPA: S-methyl-5-thioribose-1-phosphate isomerase [Alphaproteobacteria bacterium]|nr:S-methyl-5-thioribose-1-phosphate isomerase [Rhodospirillaceae bacterium]HRJ12768.1 S-methyl-5-thioribose-1-phosphate isomerase [Alphaproteobacteria bacterium]